MKGMKWTKITKQINRIDRMVYFVFDLDATLADISSVYHILTALRVKEMLSKYLSALFPTCLENDLNKAYSLFVKRVVEEENSNTPLGILRPGILPIMEKLHSLKKRGKLTSIIIYSNNKCLPCLEFVRDLIHEHVGSKRLISDCIHWDHPIRNGEKTLYPGFYPKTWKTLSSILMNNSSKLVMAKDVFFFDDLDHIDLQYTLQSNYYKVPPYTCYTSPERLIDIFSSVLNDTKINISLFISQLFHVFHVFPIEGNPAIFTINDIIGMLRGMITYTVFEPSLEKDEGIVMMNQAIERIRMNNIKMTKRTKKGRTFKKRRYTQR
jgi:hypothetical protein